MNYDRIFIFGCSWTKHQWPTWADILRYSVDIPVENWGFGGIGNVGIFHRLVECDLKNNLTDKDLILVQWSSWTREDRYKDRWMASGNIFHNFYYDETFLKNYWSWDNDVIKNSTAIISASKMFNISYQFSMLPLALAENINDSKYFDGSKDIYEFYMSKLPLMDILSNNNNSKFEGNCMDDHPDIKLHIYFYENYVRKKLNFLPEIKNKQKLLDLHYRISKSLNKKMSFQKTMETIISITEDFDKQLVSDPLGF